MKCLVCGKEYISVGVHAKHAHDLTAKEYRIEFGLKMSTPLVDVDLSQQLSRNAKQRLRDDPEWLATIQETCNQNSEKLKGSTRTIELTADAKTALSTSGKNRAKAYLENIRHDVESVYAAHKNLNAVKNILGTGRSAALKILGPVKPDRAVHTASVLKTVNQRRAPLIAALNKLLETGTPLIRACQQLSIPHGTAKKWRSAKLI